MYKYKWNLSFSFSSWRHEVKKRSWLRRATLLHTREKHQLANSSTHFLVRKQKKAICLASFNSVRTFSMSVRVRHSLLLSPVFSYPRTGFLIEISLHLCRFTYDGHSLVSY